MLKTAPNPVDVQDLQFKLHCKLSVFENSHVEPFSKKCSLVASVSQYGLLCIGTKTGFDVVRCIDLEHCSLKDGDYHRREIKVDATVTHLSVNCDGTLLAVVCETTSHQPIVQFYDVISMFSNEVRIVNRLQLSPTPGTNILEVAWNPTNPEMFTACKSDGSLGVYEIRPEVNITELPAGACATCFCWSPKGKQIAVGSRDGKITQYKPADMKAARVISAPPILNCYVTSLQWISNFQFIGIYVSSQEDDTICQLLVVDAPKTGETSFTNYEDVCFSSTPVRPIQFYLILQPLWNILMVSSSNSMEVAVLQQTGETWTQLTLMDSARAELPLSSDHSDTLPIGFALDTSSTRPLSWGEGTIPPMPRIFLLSHCGILCSFIVVNLRENVSAICEAPKEMGEIVSSLFTTASSQDVPTSNSKPIQHHQEATESVSPVTKPNADISKMFANIIPPAQGTSIFSFSDTENVPQNIPSLFKAQSNVQPFSQDNRNTFGLLTSSNEEKPISGSSQSILGNNGPLASDQLFSQENKTAFANTLGGLENRGGIKLTFNNTLGPPQHPKPIFPNSQQSLNSGIINQETAKLRMQGSQISLEQSNSIQNIEKIIDNTSTSISVVPKPQAAVSQNVESDASTVSNQADLEEDTKIGDDELNELLARMIREECIALESELKTILHRAKIIDIAIGSDNEKVKLVQSTTMLEDFLNEVVNNNAVQKSDVHILKQNLFQTWAWLEEARSRHDTINDSTIVAILKAQPLDSAAEKQLHHIKHLVYYLESQLKQAHDALDDQWENFQNYCHKTCRMQLPTMETIFQTMLHQNSTFQKLTYQVKDISAKIKARDQLKLSSPSLVDLNSLKKIEHAMETLSMQPQDIFKLQYERIVTKNRLMSPVKTQKLRNYLKQNDVKHISSFKTSIPEPKLQALRETNYFVSDTGVSKKPLQTRAIPDENIDHMKFISGSATYSNSLPVNATEKFPQSSFSKPLLFGSAFVPTSIFDSSSSSAPLKSIPASSSEKTTVFSIPNISPVTTASLFGLPITTKSLTTKSTPSAQIQDTVTSQTSPGLALQKGISYSIDQARNLVFEYPNPVNPNAPVVVIETSNLPVTSTPKFYPFKMPTDEISITKVRSAPTTKSIFNPPKDTEITKTDTPIVSLELGKSSTEPGKISTTSFCPTSYPSSLKSNFGDLGSTTITFKRGELPVISNDATNNIVNSAITKPVIVSKVVQPVTSSVVSTSPVDANLLSNFSNEATNAKSITTPVSVSSKPTQSVFSEHNITTKSTLPVTETTMSQANVSSFGSLFSTALENTKIQPISSTNIFGGSLAANTKSEAKTAGSIFSTDINTSSLIFGNTSGGNTTQSQSNTQASSIFGLSKQPVVDTPLEATDSKAEENANVTKTVLGSVPQQISKMFGGGVPVISTASSNVRKSSDEKSAPLSTQTNIFAAAAAVALSKSKENEKAAISQTITFGTTTSTTSVASHPVSVSATEGSIFGTVQPSISSNAIQGSIFAASTPSTTKNIFGGSVNTVTTTSPSIFGGFGISPSTNMPPTSIFQTATTSSAPSTFGISKATTPVFASPLATSTTTTEVIGATAASVTPPIFGTTPAASAFNSAPTNTTNTAQSIFGGPTVSTTSSPFGATAASTSSSVFGTPAATSVTAPFGSTVIASSAPLSFATTGKSIFGNTSAFASTSSSAFTGQSAGSIFGAPANTPSSTSSSNVFATQSTGFRTFGNATTTPSSQNFQPTSPFGGVFGGGSSPSTSSAPGTTMFGTSKQFGTAPLTSSNLFGASAPTTNTSAFPSSASNTSFGFGGLNVGATTTSSQFGATSANPFAKSSSIFGGTPPTQSSVFGGVSQSTQSSSIFGTGTPSSQSSSIFGAGSAFGSSASTQGAFGGASSFGGTPAFGQQPAFGQSTFGNPQPGPFSGGSSSIAQTGFGTPSTTQKPGGFGSPPMFGSAPSFGSSPSFGGAPTFGSSPSFGSPGKIFGGGAPLGGFQAASTQENSTFANLASQNTVGFGNLAQQAQNSPSSAFSGNSSFSSWR